MGLLKHKSKILALGLFFIALSTIADTLIFRNHQDSLKAGELIFNGISLTGDTILNCAKCHNIKVTDTFNFNPSAFDIGLKHKTNNCAQFEEIVLFPMTDAAFEAHERLLDYSSDNICLIKAYLDHIASVGLTVERKWQLENFIMLILLLCLIFLLSDLFFFKLINKNKIHIASFAIIIITVLIIMYPHVLAYGLQQGYEPVQPVKFSHKTHAGQNGTECLYCHMPARYGRNAGIPATDICMNCHASVTEGSSSGEFEIRKVYTARDSAEPIPWIRINNLPDHVYFNHMAHYKIGKIDCVECHGNVEEHNRLSQFKELSMKWCLDCHESRRVQLPENRYYHIFTKELEKLFNNEKDSVLVKETGGWECVGCHY